MLKIMVLLQIQESVPYWVYLVTFDEVFFLFGQIGIFILDWRDRLVWVGLWFFFKGLFRRLGREIKFWVVPTAQRFYLYKRSGQSNSP
jgi:hypothetical protein